MTRKVYFDVDTKADLALLKELGFRKNTKLIKGFIPHFRKGDDVLFLIGSSFGPRKIYTIARCFENYTGKVYGVLTEKAPHVSHKDWATAPELTLLNLRRRY